MTIQQVAPDPAVPAPAAAPSAGPQPEGPPPAPVTVVGGGVTARRRGPAAPVRRLGWQALLMLAALAALCAAAVAGAVVVRSGADRLRETVTERAATAAGLRFALADLDAQRADVLVPGHSADRPAVLPAGRSADDFQVGNRVLALLTARQRRAEVSDLLRRLGGDPDQGRRVRALLDGLGRYDELTARSSAVDETAPDRPAGRPPAGAVTLSVDAGEVMHRELLPAADALASGYARRAAGSADRAHGAAVTAAWATAGTGVAALAVLGWCQWRLAHRYRRVFSPALCAATVAAAVVAALGTVAFLAAADGVRDAARDGLRPWARLAEARAVAAEAAATQGRWFVYDTRPGSAAVSRFEGLTARLDTLLAPDGYSYAPGRAAHRAVRDGYARFRDDDRRMREEQATGRTDAAVLTLTELGRGRLPFDFWEFAGALDALAARHLAVLEERTASARDRLAGWPAVPAGVLGGAALLVGAGLRPRFAEYR
ncbi:hypothetical protein [Streptomyces mobaraensis]|uniref:Secreted protein n=1 Tax=Streptomyces mobaraensis TaxID=35621 RepID=A0A5N5W7U9_STRMB|nr:hypothetical protein [Streptomyces mobaraensis]KAB7845067.1 hypothetical protein FRZ00_15295 [Streptomyces mobaraensis]